MMEPFPRIGQTLHAEQVPIDTIIQAVGTPTFIYSETALIENYQAFAKAFASHPTLICFAVKSNSNLAVLNTLAKLQSGFDIVSGGELARVIKAGGDPKRVVFSGIGKTGDEIAYALQQGIYCFNVESESELTLLQQIATHLNLQAPIALRVNPDVDPKSHPYISTGLKTNKFGIPLQEAFTLAQKAAQHPHCHLRGIACHIGSQITTLEPFEVAFAALFDLAAQLQATGIPLMHVDIGGGLGVTYHEEHPPTLNDYATLALRYCRSEDHSSIRTG